MVWTVREKLLVSVTLGALALAVACGKDVQTPVSPSAGTAGDSGAAADGSTLKATAPTPQSPINGAQPDTLVLTTGAATARFISIPLSYQYEIKNSAGQVVHDSGVVASTSYTVPATAQLDFDQPHTWRVRAVYQSGGQTFYGPWSAVASFRTPLGGYVRGNEVYDPLTNGKTVGEIRGPTQFIPGQGLRLLAHESHVKYVLNPNLQAGEFSLMVLGADEGSPGDKSKVFAMEEGPEGDFTDDDYRMSVELRGNQHFQPGAVGFRIIFGDGVSRDSTRVQVNFDSSRWYFWRFTWRTGLARLEVRRDGPTGPVVYDRSAGSGSHPYRPEPHLGYIGAPIGRGCACDATLPFGIYKNVWISPNPRPNLPD